MIDQKCVAYLTENFPQRCSYYMTDDEKAQGHVDFGRRLRDFSNEDVRFVLRTHKIVDAYGIICTFARNVADDDIASHVFGFDNFEKEAEFRKQSGWMKNLEKSKVTSQSGSTDQGWLDFKRNTVERLKEKEKKK